MADEKKDKVDPKSEENSKSNPKPEGSASRRQIPGNLPYLTSYGTLKKMLEKAIELAKPDKFNYDFLENVVKMRGGTAKSCIPILKKMNFLNSDGTPTELYSKFRTESGRSRAVYEGLRSAFPEIFKRSDYAYSLEEQKIRDIIVEITGLKSNDPVAKAIKGTFLTVRSFIEPTFNHANDEQSSQSESDISTTETLSTQTHTANDTPSGALGISYNINIVVPETSDLNVLNAIFRSVKENLLK